MKPYYDADGITIYHGDCREVLPQLSVSVNLTVTSPPYNQLGSRIPTEPSGVWALKVAAFSDSVTRNGYADDLSEQEYMAMQVEIANAVAGVSVAGASCFYNHKLRWRDKVLLHPLEIVRAFSPAWELRQELIWSRNGGTTFNARMFCPSDERIYWLVKPGAPWKWNQDAMRWMSVWNIPAIADDGKHPCAFPKSIAGRPIAATTDPGDLVLDPFMGSGTTLVAAREHGRRAIGIEREERYCELAAKRLAQRELFGVST